MNRKFRDAWWKIQEVLFLSAVYLGIGILCLLGLAFVLAIVFSPFIGIGALMVLGKKLFAP